MSKVETKQLENVRIKQVKDILRTFTREEPFISNAAIRIAILFDKEHNYELVTSKDLEREAYKRGYNTGYQAALRKGKRQS